MDIFFIIKDIIPLFTFSLHLLPRLTTNQVEKPATILLRSPSFHLRTTCYCGQDGGLATGISFQSVISSSFHCLVTDVKIGVPYS